MPRHDDIGLLPDRPAACLNLLAGQLYFGHRVQELRTLLGSCVGLALWCPTRRLGGMCHYLLPDRARPPGTPRDGRYGAEALEMMVEAMKAAGARPQEFEAHLYGGADTLSDRTGMRFNVGARNIELGWSLIDQYGLQLMDVDVGDQCPRHVRLSLVDGQVTLRRSTPREIPA